MLVLSVREDDQRALTLDAVEVVQREDQAVVEGGAAFGLQTGKPIFIIQWQEGRRRLVYPDELARYELIYPFPAWESR